MRIPQRLTKSVQEKTDETLQYEVRDMQRYIEQGHDDGELEFSRDVAHILDDVRSDWGMRYPFEK